MGHCVGLGWAQEEMISLQSVAYLTPTHEMEYSKDKCGLPEVQVKLVKPNLL